MTEIDLGALGSYPHTTIKDAQDAAVERMREDDAKKENSLMEALRFHNFDAVPYIEQMKAMAGEQVFILDGIAPRGSMTALYAPPNAGKTLATLKLLSLAVSQPGSVIDAGKVFYINADDSLTGAVAKAEIAQEFGFKTLVPGWAEFSNSMLKAMIQNAIDTGDAHNQVLILDTLKKYSDLMNKTANHAFNELLRSYTLVGGTVIALVHTNKLRVNGDLIEGGTSDVKEDFDNSFILDPGDPATGGKATIRFIRGKNRDGVVSGATYTYLAGDGLTYRDRFDSFEKVDESRSEPAPAVDNSIVDELLKNNASKHVKKIRAGMKLDILQMLANRHNTGTPDKATYNIIKDDVKALRERRGDSVAMGNFSKHLGQLIEEGMVEREGDDLTVTGGGNIAANLSVF